MPKLGFVLVSDAGIESRVKILKVSADSRPLGFGFHLVFSALDVEIGDVFLDISYLDFPVGPADVFLTIPVVWIDSI
jgi:hypothetical protein